MSLTDRCLVGMPLPHWALASIHGSARLHVDPQGPVLILYADEPSESERRAVADGRVELALMPAGQHVMYLLYRIAGLTEGWSDLPWGIALLTPEERMLLARCEVYRTLLIVLADSASGSVAARRGVLPSDEFRSMASGIIRAMWHKLPQASVQLCAQEIEASSRRYQSTEAMLREAVPLNSGSAIEVIA